MIYQDDKLHLKSPILQKKSLDDIIKTISKADNKSKNNYSNDSQIKKLY